MCKVTTVEISVILILQSFLKKPLLFFLRQDVEFVMNFMKLKTWIVKQIVLCVKHAKNTRILKFQSLGF